jgi:hypothetical protein
MKAFSKINIKGKRIWKLCALVVLGVFLACCVYKIYNIQQPASANAGDVVTFVTRDSVQTNIVASPLTTNYVLAILLPKGFAGAKNCTVSFTSTLGNGNCEVMPNTVLEPESVSQGKNLTWPAACLAKFGIGANLVPDLEWVVFRSVQTYPIPNEIHLVGDVTFKIKVGADGNTTIFKPAYIMSDASNGIAHYDAGDPDYGYSNGPRFVCNGPGDLNDLCDPQLTSFDPPKALDNDFITISYNERLDTLHTLKGTNLYLCVDSVTLLSGSKLTGFCQKSAKTKLVQTSANSGLYKITIWPRSFFSLTSSQTINRIYYHIIDDAGNEVGLGDTSSPFVNRLSCN